MKKNLEDFKDKSLEILAKHTETIFQAQYATLSELLGDLKKNIIENRSINKQNSNHISQMRREFLIYFLIVLVALGVLIYKS